MKLRTFSVPPRLLYRFSKNFHTFPHKAYLVSLIPLYLSCYTYVFEYNLVGMIFFSSYSSVIVLIEVDKRFIVHV